MQIKFMFNAKYRLFDANIVVNEISNPIIILNKKMPYLKIRQNQTLLVNC